MSGFIRRFGYFPPVETITLIEGVIIVDLPPPGGVSGISTGVVAAVGEYADMSAATAADASGNITTKIVPQQIFGGKDLIDKMGGFDETIGEFGVSQGNGYVSLRNKRFAQLVCVPVNLCSARGVRVWRDLPLSRSVSDPSPVLPVVAASVLAGREFRNGSGRLRMGRRVDFTAFEPMASGTGAAWVNAASAVTQGFTIGSGDWSTIARPDGTVGVRKGDLLCIGYNNGGVAAPVAPLSGIFRVAADAVLSTALSLEKMDGSAYTATAVTNLPWRLHVSSDADSAFVRVPGAALPGGYGAADAGGYGVAARPLTTGAGTTVDGTWTSGTTLTPALVPAALTGSSWDPLSGLAGRTSTGGTLAFTAAVQGVNVASSASIDALYSTAIDALLADKAPARNVNIIVCSRKSATIRNKMKSHVLAVSAQGVGRVCVISPALDLITATAATADADPGVGANRSESVIYAWPGALNSVPEAVNFRLKTADGLTTLDGILDDSCDFWGAAVMSNLPPENNPGQAASPVPEIMAPILGFQRGLADLGINEYIQLRSRGVMGLRIDETAGPIFQSGITTSLVAGEKNINRRRFSYFVQDSISRRLNQYAKLRASAQMRDGATGECMAFCEELLAKDNPPASRINDYQVDDKSGNTPGLLAKGIYVIITRIQMTPTADFIVLQTEIGEGVVITSVNG
jgi:hypothetical protein